jgi:hypothetical protein
MDNPTPEEIAAETHGDHGELLPGNSGFEEAIAQGEFDLARSRFVRTISHDALSDVVERVTKVRAKLRTDINNLRLVVRNKHETALEYARAYGMILPHRVGRTWIQPPGQLEKIGEFYGADRAYKQAARAAKEYVEVRELLLKRREQAFYMEDKLRADLDAREASLLHQLESPRALKMALLRDPLLDMAYKKLKTLQGELAGTAVPPIEDGLGDL